MKHIYQLSTFVFLFIQSVNSCHAQVSTLYTFSQNGSVYSAISGGTVFGSATSDDQFFLDQTSLAGFTAGSSASGISIGFNFMFNNVIYDRIGIANDGWIMFGLSALGNTAVNSNSSNYYTPISATSTASLSLQNRVAALARDLQGQTGSELRVETLGSAPNRSLVIQWTNYRKYNATGDNFNFQIRLYETSNIVEIIYGTFVNGATAGVAELGLRGTSNADYNNRITSALNIWSNSIPGTANNAQVNFNNTPLVPNTGQSYKWTPPQCSGTLASLPAVGSSAFVCPGASATLSLSNSYTTSGITYQWLSSTSSSVGPYVPVSNANTAIYTASSVTASIWYQVVSACLSSASTVTSSAVNIQVAASTINNIPYSESFEGLIVNNQLPNCSWIASNLPAVCQTYTTANTNNRIPFTGNKFAAFKSGTNANGDYFYTNGLQLSAGVIYSASVAYITDGNLGWSNFSMLYGSTQSSVGLTPIASVGPATGLFYQQLSNTFTVPANGVYYIAIKCIATTNPLFLSFDDIRVTAPCSLNSPTMQISASSNTACSGQAITITASGANTYTWFPGENNAVITVTPSSSTSYNVFGTNTLSGCTASAGVGISVLPSPLVSLLATPSKLCVGATATLNAFGASTYAWSNGASGQVIFVSPTVSTNYVVIGQASNGCSATASVQMVVNPLPVLSINSSVPNELCAGETLTLSATGAMNYQWAANTLFIQSALAVVSPTISTNYTLTGTDANSCSASLVYNQQVISCVGLKENSANPLQLQVYPNPASSDLIIRMENLLQKHITLSDVQGRILKSVITLENLININIHELSQGVYTLKVLCGADLTCIKVVKN